MSLQSISEFSGAASLMYDIVTSANGLVTREANTGEGGIVGVGACSRWALIRGWAFIRINTVLSKHHEVMCENLSPCIQPSGGEYRRHIETLKAGD